MTLTESFDLSFGSAILSSCYLYLEVQCYVCVTQKLSVCCPELELFGFVRPHFSAQMSQVNPRFVQGNNKNENNITLTPAMASRTCWKCLTRPSKFPGVSNQGYISSKCPLVSSFSTSATLYDVNPKSKKVSRQTGPAVKTLRLKKKTPIAKGRPPAPGERKAMRKRIVLSNSNALEVPNMVDMTAELDAAQIGMVVGLQGPLVDQLRVVEAFKTTQRWSLFRRPAVLIREDSVVISKMLNKTQDEKKTSVVIIDGERGSGKSLLLLQAMAMAFLRGWIVVNIPEGKNILILHGGNHIDTRSLQHKI